MITYFLIYFITGAIVWPILYVLNEKTTYWCPTRKAVILQIFGGAFYGVLLICGFGLFMLISTLVLYGILKPYCWLMDQDWYLTVKNSISKWLNQPICKRDNTP